MAKRFNQDRYELILDALETASAAQIKQDPWHTRRYVVAIERLHESLRGRYPAEYREAMETICWQGRDC